MKQYAVVFTPRAEGQLDRLFEYIAKDSGEARADKFIARIVADCLTLSLFPKRGAKRDDIRPGLRTKGFARRVTIAFSVDAPRITVVIHGIFYGGQDFEPVLREGTD